MNDYKMIKKYIILKTNFHSFDNLINYISEYLNDVHNTIIQLSTKNFWTNKDRRYMYTNRKCVDFYNSASLEDQCLMVQVFNKKNN